jgi:hypothetical protein
VSNPSFNYLGDGASGVNVWGIMVEVNSLSTSGPSAYIPTTTAAASITDYSISNGNTAVLAPTQNPIGESPLGTGNASQTSWTAVNPLGPAPTVANVWRTDWQGKQRMYTTSRTNLAKYSRDMTGTGWTSDGCTTTANQIVSPDGVTAGNKIVEGVGINAGAGHKVYSAVTATNGTFYTLSFDAKAGTRTYIQAWTWGTTETTSAFYNLNTGVCSGSGNPTMRSLGNGWWRCTKTSFTSAPTFNYAIGPSDGTNTQAYSGDGVSYVYAGEVQVEIGVLATSFIYTTTAAVTVTDISISGSTVTFTTAPATGATLTWDGYYTGGLAVGSTLQWSGTYTTGTGLGALPVGADEGYLNQALLAPISSYAVPGYWDSTYSV